MAAKSFLLSLAAASALLAATGARAELISNGGFEAPNLGVSNYAYPGGTLDGWTYSGSALVNAQGSSAWYGAAAPAGFGGGQFAALQSSSSLSQTFTSPGGTLDVSWLSGGRPNFGSYAGDQSYVVKIDGATKGSYSTVSGQSFSSDLLKLTGLSAGSHTLVFQGLSPQDETAFVDNVSISAVPETSTWAMMLIGSLGIGFASRNARRRTLAVAVCAPRAHRR